MKKVYWLALHPDIRQPVGGVKQMHRLSESLTAIEQENYIIQQNADFSPRWFKSEVKTISLDRFKYQKVLDRRRDIIVLPETFIEDIPTYCPGIPKIIFNQNGAYSFGMGNQFPNPKKVLSLYEHPDVIHVMCVSKHDEELLSESFSLGQHKVSRIINAIETEIFYPPAKKHRCITYMPRKNERDAEIVAALLSRQDWFRHNGWKLISIDGKTQTEVAALMQKSLIFLAFGHPEGFGLPLAEAAACGCFLIGYSGLGGKEIFEICTTEHTGIEIKFGNWLDFTRACKKFDTMLSKDSQRIINSLIKSSKATRQQYSASQMTKSVATAFAKWSNML